MKTRNLFSAAICMLLLIAMSCEKDQTNEDPVRDESLQANGDVATEWFLLLSDISKDTPYSSPQTARIFAYSGLALYESVAKGIYGANSIYTYLSGGNIQFDDTKTYFWPASANAAMSRITTKMLADFPETPNLAAIQQLDSSFNASYKSLVTPEELQRSRDFGIYIADLIYDWSTKDGNSANCPSYTPEDAADKWKPTPPLFQSAEGACMGTYRTFSPESIASILPPTPPAYSTDPNSGFYQENETIYEITIKPDSSYLPSVMSWQDIPGTNYNTPAHMMKLSAELLKNSNFSLEHAAPLLAKEGMAVSDAMAAAYYAKYHYALLRPVTYLEDVMAHPDWNSVGLTPPSPSYPALAPAVASAAVTMLANYFGRNYPFLDDTQAELYGAYSYESFDGLLEDVAQSRWRSGINYDFSVRAGAQVGVLAAHRISNLPFHIF